MSSQTVAPPPPGATPPNEPDPRTVGTPDGAMCPPATSGLAGEQRAKASPADAAHGAQREAIDRRRMSEWPRHEIATFVLLLAATLGFYLVGLAANGYANSFYSAAAQAGSQSWSAFFFGSSDAGNSITVDKPPASLWVMALSVRMFGLNSIAILLPEVLMGVASVGLLYRSVRRYVGHVGGMVAGLVLALTPIAVLMFRFNNPDALLTLLLVAAAWATLRAIEPDRHGDDAHKNKEPAGEGQRRFARVHMTNGRWFALVGVFLGLAFLTKTLQAFVVLPVFGLVYLVAAPVSWRQRLLHAVGALAAMIGAGGWWVAIIELLPSGMRPYIGGSQSNSFLELTFGYNGLGRIDGNETGSVGGGNGWGTPGLLRMFTGASGGHTAWFIATGLIILAAGLWATRRAPRTDGLRASYLVWGGWMLLTGAVFSLMAGIYHDYYTIALAPGIAGLVGLGAGHGWEHIHGRAADDDEGSARWWSIVLALGTAAAAITGFALLTRVAGSAYGPLRYAVLAVGLAATLLFLVIGRLHLRAVPVVAIAALLAVLAGPAAYCVSTVATAHNGSIITAGPAGAGFSGPGGGRGGFAPATAAQNRTQQNGNQGFGRPPRGATRGGMGGLLDAATPNAQIVAALEANASRYRWVAATVGSQSAAGLQLGSGEPVMPIGGFNGSDPSPTPAQFRSYVAAGQIHYFASGMGGGRGGPGGRSGNGTAAQITAWVQANFSTVTIGGQTFYDLSQPLSAASSSAAATS